MFNGRRWGAALVVVLGVVMTAVTPTVAQPGNQSHLELRRYKFHLDGDGRIWLTVQLANSGHRTIRVEGIAPRAAGPWTILHKTIAPDATIKGDLKVAGKSPAVIWVDCTEGLVRIDLPSRQ